VSGGPQPPIRPIKGEVIRLRADRDALPCERIIVGERFYLVPRPDGEVVLGATVEERGFDLSVSAGGVHELLREAYRALPELAELEFVEAAAGLRPGTPDNAPIIGPLGSDSALIVGGLYRHGVLLAPLIAEAAGALLTGGALPSELVGLGLDRFATLPEAAS
jgi:glycine oxidase